MKKILSFCLSLLLAASLYSPVVALGSYNQAAEMENSSILDDLWKSEYIPEDIHLLARVIHGESRGETYEGKLAVGAVIMNRVKSPLFPNTIKEVVYQPKAFTCVQDGQINLRPDGESYRAAFDALLGKDPTDGCLFYYNPKTATSRWMQHRRSMHVVAIGNHIFMK